MFIEELETNDANKLLIELLRQRGLLLRWFYIQSTFHAKLQNSISAFDCLLQFIEFIWSQDFTNSLIAQILIVSTSWYRLHSLKVFIFLGEFRSDLRVYTLKDQQQLFNRCFYLTNYWLLGIGCQSIVDLDKFGCGLHIQKCLDFVVFSTTFPNSLLQSQFSPCHLILIDFVLTKEINQCEIRDDLSEPLVFFCEFCHFFSIIVVWYFVVVMVLFHEMDQPKKDVKLLLIL